MIFVTTGTQLPFPRLIDAMADLAPELDEPIVAQVGPDTRDRPGLELHATLAPAEFARHFEAARVIVAHAGIGSILSAQRYGKPLVMMPRRHDLAEHRNDHQAATAREVSGRPGLYIANNTGELRAVLTDQKLSPARAAESPEYTRLITRLRAFIQE